MESQHSFDAPDGLPPRTHDPNTAPPAPAVARRREPLRRAHDEWLRPGAYVAAVAAAATAGVLVRFGIASGVGAFGVFAQAGRLASGVSRADGAAAHGVAILAGLFVHLLVVSTWSLAYAWATVGRGTGWRWAAAAVTSTLAWAVGHFVLPGMLRVGHGAGALPPQMLLLHIVLALSLAIGMRLALEAGDEH